jgi:thiamine biosynthesis lipoprotein
VAGRDLVEPAGFGRAAFPAMGTTVTVLLPTDSTDRAADVRGLFDEWEATLSRFRPDSELAALNAAAGREARVSPLLFDVVGAAMEAARATDGLFDPLLGVRMVELGYDDTFARLPSDRPARPLAPWRPGAWRDVRLDARLRTVSLPDGAAFDVGGIAKGMAVDASLRLLAASGVSSAAVNAGGDIAVLGRPADAPAWTIQIETPDGTPEPIVAVTSGGLATSSIGRRRWSVGRSERHHLLDPRDGLPARTNAWSVSVLASSCRVAEVAAKVALILGTVQGAAFLRERGLSGAIVAEDGGVTAVAPDRTAAGAPS